MIKDIRSIPFNSPLETGMRSLSILLASYPISFDLQRLVEMDYIVVHSADFGGPESLHAPLPLRQGELLVRRSIIEKGLLLMMSRGLIARLHSHDGFKFLATESAAPFITSLTAGYSRELILRAQWAVSKFSDASTEEIRKLTSSLFDQWTSEFQPTQHTERD